MNEVACATNRRRSTVTFAPKDTHEIVSLPLHLSSSISLRVLCAVLMQMAWESEGRMVENTLETFLSSWRRARQKHQDSEEDAVPLKQTSKQRRGKGRAVELGGGVAHADADIITDMFPL